MFNNFFIFLIVPLRR